MTQGSYSLTSETLTALATAFTDQSDQMGAVVAGAALTALLDGMDLAWGDAGFFSVRGIYLAEREPALAGLEVLAGILRNVGAALSDLALRYQAADTQASDGFTQVAGDGLSAAGLTQLGGGISAAGG